MKKIFLTLLTISFFFNSLSQDTTKKILKITYKSIPVSQQSSKSRESIKSKEDELDYELSAAHKRFYTLYINLINRASIYKFDSLNFIKPKGREHVKLLLADDLEFCIKNDSNITYKHEILFDREFYTAGKVGNIQWNITNEKKQMLGFNCTKAVSKNKDLYLTIWFTTDIPVSSGPVNYFGLPGLVVWAEDFFRTTQIEKVEYSSDLPFFNNELKKWKMKFELQKKKNYLEEPLFLEKKIELLQSLSQMVNAQNQ